VEPYATQVSAPSEPEKRIGAIQRHILHPPGHSCPMAEEQILGFTPQHFSYVVLIKDDWQKNQHRYHRLY